MAWKIQGLKQKTTKRYQEGKSFSYSELNKLHVESLIYTKFTMKPGLWYPLTITDVESQAQCHVAILLSFFNLYWFLSFLLWSKVQK